MRVTFDIAEEREVCLKEQSRLIQRLNEAKTVVSSMNRKKCKLRHQEKCTRQVNKELAIAVDDRDAIKTQLHEIGEKIRYFKKICKNNRCFSDYFMEVCERDLDKLTFEYLKSEAAKAREVSL